MVEAQEGWTVILQAASGFGWLATAFGTWLLLPAWWHIIQEKPRNFSWKVFQYFCWWLAGDFLHLTALLLEGAGLHQWILYVIIAAFETGILITLALYAHVFHFIKWPRPWQSKLSDEVKNKPHAAHIGAAGFMFSVLPEEDMTPKRKLFGIDRKLAHNLLGTAFFIACAVAVWLVVAVFQLTNLPVPHPSLWPHDAKTIVAYVFAWIGFCCWVWPRIWVIYKREDDIDTSSVVIGLGAHFCNMANIAFLNFRAEKSARAQLPFFATSFICSGLDIARLILKKKNDKTILHAYKEKNYLQKDAKYQSKKEKDLRREQRKIDSEREKRNPGLKPVFPKRGPSPYEPRYHSDFPSDSDSSQSTSPHPPRPIPDVAQLILGFGLPLNSKERRRLQPDMARKPGEARPELQEHLDRVIKELTEREKKVDEELDDLLEKEHDWMRGKEQRESRKLDKKWYSITEANGYSALPTDLQRLFAEEIPLTHEKEEREQYFGGIDYQASQTLRLAKFVHGDKSEFVRKLNNEIRMWEMQRENLMGQILLRRSLRRNEPLEPPVSHAAPLPPASSRPRRSTSASVHDRPPHSSSPHDSAVPTPETPTLPSPRFHSLRHQRRRSFDSDSSFSSSESDSERSVDEEELLARNRYSRSKGGRRYVERW